MLTVVARYRAKAGMGDEIARILTTHAAATRQEPGCATFVAARDVDDPDRFLLFEQYDDEAAFRRHRQTPHFRNYIEGQVAPLLEERAWTRLEERR